ncbi:MAG: S9 family peptidase [Pseudomonadota bacterium]
MRPLLSLAAALVFAPAAFAQTGEPLTVERVYASPSLSGPTPRAVRFSPDGERISFLRAKEEDRTVLDLWAMDVADGRTYRLVDAQVLAPEERELSEAEIQFRERARISQSGVVAYDWDEAGEAVLVPLDGDVFYIDVESGEARRLMQTDAFETDARISPRGGYVSFIREQNLWLHDLESGEERALTTEGGALISWGVAEFVAQEEMNRLTGYWWSPDETRLAVARVDESPVMVVPRFGINAEGVTITEQRYPRAGTDNARVSLHIIELETGALTEISLGPDSDIYLARVNWASDGSAVYVQRQTRLQERLDLLRADPATGEAAIVLSEADGKWINLSSDFHPLADGGFLWTSERTGFRHIYRYDAEGGAAQLTSGDWVVNAISGVSEDGSTVYFTGWTETATERHLYAVPIEGGEPQRITSGAGNWAVNLGQGASAFIGAYSDPNTPPNTGLYSIDGDRIAWVEENALDGDHPYAPYLADHIAPEFGRITAADGQTPLNYMMYRPDHCTAEAPCPAIVHVYGGPTVGQSARKTWRSMTEQLYARAGYVYFRLDNRGTPNRGHAFEAALHLRMGQVEVEDQLAGLDYLQGLDFVDADRVGLWGWSYGGYMTLMTALQAPGRFAAGISGAPVSDWSLYDTHYTERYMGLPQDNAEGYAAGDVLSHVEGYETPLLLIHGMADDNVTYDHSTRLYAALQEQGEVFEVMAYPGQRHGIRPPALQIHLARTMSDFFARHLNGPQLASEAE